MPITAPGRKAIRVSPVRASAAEAAWLRNQLQNMVYAMHNSVMFWVRAGWRDSGMLMDMNITQGGIALDKSPAKMLQEVMSKLGKQWLDKFDDAAPKIADGFAKKVLRHADGSFSSALRKAGYSVKFQTTKAVRDALDAETLGNVSLIKSIPQKYLGDVQGRIMRSITGGRSMKQLTKDLEQVYSLTHNRAALIARDQNNKATAVIHKTRQKEVGISRAVWIHTSASVHPREEHERWGDEEAEYDIEKGMWSEVDQEYVWPGTPINCGCTSMSVVPGMDDED